MEQTIFLRDDDARNPVLLFLHGGPGVPEMPIWRANRELEKDFTVVHWDQRGAGKSYDATLSPAQVALAYFVADTDELARALFYDASVSGSSTLSDIPGDRWSV